MVERTFSIIKPDAVAAGKAGAVLSGIEAAGLRRGALRMRALTRAEAEGVYRLRIRYEWFLFEDIDNTYIEHHCVVLSALFFQTSLERFDVKRA